MKHDSIGYIFVGLSVLFLIGMLYGHKRREHFGKESSVWDTLRVSVENEVGKFMTYDIGQFRKDVANQNDFFASEESDLSKYQVTLGLPMGAPTPAEVKNTNSLFDEKIRIMKEYETSQGKITKDLSGLHNKTNAALSVAILKTLAKQYMYSKIQDQENISTKTVTQKVFGS
jgi:hypothetical protein